VPQIAPQIAPQLARPSRIASLAFASLAVLTCAAVLTAPRETEAARIEAWLAEFRRAQREAIAATPDPRELAARLEALRARWQRELAASGRGRPDLRTSAAAPASR
jgi:hypothetical protein